MHRKNAGRLRVARSAASHAVMVRAAIALATSARMQHPLNLFLVRLLLAFLAFHRRTMFAIVAAPLLSMFRALRQLALPILALLHMTAASALTPTSTVVIVSDSTPFQGQFFSATAHVVGNSPTGRVTFIEGSGSGREIGIASLDASGDAVLWVALNESIGTYIRAVYPGDANNAPTTLASGDAHLATVAVQNRAITKSQLQWSGTSTVVGQPTTLTATVTGRSSSTRDEWLPTPSFDFTDGGVALGTAVVDKSSNTATLAPSFSSAGTRSVQAKFSGTVASFPSTSEPLIIYVQKRTSSIALASGATSVLQGEPLTLTATVTGTNPSGSVTFLDGAAVLGSATLSAGGVATFQVRLASSGTHPLTAQYLGDTNHFASTSATLAQAIGAKTSATATLSAASNTATAGDTVLLTASVSGASPGGVVAFKAGDATLGAANLTSGSAQLQASFAHAGTFALTANYAGDSSNLAATSNQVAISIGKHASATKLAVDPKPQYQNQPVTLTAQVTGLSPSGQVVFSNNGKSLGTGALVAGQASLSTNIADIGAFSLSATYSGDADNLSSTSSSQAADGTQGSAQPALPVSPVPVAKFEYDAEGNPTKTIVAPDTRNFATQQGYDSLGRRTSTTNAKNGVTQFGYDLLDQLTSVTDPRNLATQYQPTALGDVTQLTSPDTGIATSTYDAAGNLKTRTDARSVLATYTYDALNRPTQIAYGKTGDTTRTVKFTYDQTGTDYGYGVGRLTTMQSPDVSTAFRYDALGQVTATKQVGGNRALTVTYEYDAAGRVIKMTYPSGRVYNYTRVNGEVQSISKTSGTDTLPLLGQVVMGALGQPVSWTWTLVAGQPVHTRVYDTSGRMVRHPLGPLVRDITYDDADRVSRFTHYTAATAASAPAYDQSFGYDELSRLISVTGGTNWSYAYDANGNRTASAAGSTARGYTVATSSNRLSALTSPARSMGYDTVGNTLSDSETGSSANYTARYTLEGRLAAMTQGTTAGIELFYDAKGRRVVRSAWTGSSSNPRTVTLYAYDLDSHLIGEYNADGTPITEYVWLGDIPVAMIKLNGATTATYAVHTDHLNTPRVVLDAGGQVRWRWLGEPFGASAAEEQPTSGLAAVQLNLRFPGQQYEAFGGRYYNHFRDYDPTIGRYVQSDPIGLDGGINTYAYVNGNPVSFTDPLGLQSIVGCAANPAAAETCAEAGIINATPAPNAARLAVPIAKAISKECTSDGKDPCDELEQKVRDAKDHMGRTYSKGEAVCKPGMPRSELIRRANDWLRLAKARAQRDQRCFAGGDENHQIEQATAWKQVALCQGLFRNAN